MAGKDPQRPLSIGKLIVTEQLTVGRDLHLADLVARPHANVGISPPLPDLFIGRERDLRDAKRLLAIGEPRPAPGDGRTLLVVRGWPGVGKSSLSAVLAQDEAVREAFPDGTLWTSLGRSPELASALAAWGRALGQNLTQLGSVEEASGRLATLLQDRRMLLIVDDVWEPVDARPFLVGGAGCGHLVTTHIRACAEELAAAGAVWGVAEPLATARELLDHGLLEPAGTGRFQMHSLLCMYAESLLEAQS